VWSSCCNTSYIYIYIYTYMYIDLVDALSSIINVYDPSYIHTYGMSRWRPVQSPLWLQVGLLGIKRPLLQGYFAEETTLSLKRPSNLDSPYADLSLATLCGSLLDFQRAFFSLCFWAVFFVGRCGQGASEGALFL